MGRIQPLSAALCSYTHSGGVEFRFVCAVNFLTVLHQTLHKTGVHLRSKCLDPEVASFMVNHLF